MRQGTGEAVTPRHNQMSTPESRKVLEEIQKTKTTLLKQGATAGSGGGGPLGNLQISHPISNNHFPLSSVSDVHASPTQRQALQALQEANARSFGSFIASDSHFGNAILPVLPRLQDLNKPKVEF